MAHITEIRHQASAEAAQRLALAARGDIEYVSCEDFEHDVDLVISLCEEARDACWPSLENRAREKARAAKR